MNNDNLNDEKLEFNDYSLPKVKTEEDIPERLEKRIKATID